MVLDAYMHMHTHAHTRAHTHTPASFGVICHDKLTIAHPLPSAGEECLPVTR